MADFLNGFDMVLALTQGAVNSQFATIFKNGYTDPSKAILPKEVDWKIPDGRGTIKATLGAPEVSFMPNNNNYQNATFILNFVSGSFTQYSIDTSDSPPKIVEHKKDIQNWKVGFMVDLTKMAFGTAARNQAQANGAIDDKAHQTLQDYSDNLFSVDALIFDFASANIASFDPHHTSLPGLTPDEQLSLANTLTVYFKKERKAPFIIAIHASSKNPAATATGVEPTLVPTGVAYTTFGNSTKPAQGPVGSLSTLNYLTTTGGHASPAAVPNGVFTTPIVTDNNSSGRLLISRASFVENFILRNFGNKLGAAFTTSNPRASVSTANKPGVSYHKSGTFFDPGTVDTSSSTVITTNASLSSSGAQIDITGSILTKAKYSITFIWNGTWTVWKQINFSGTINIDPTADSHSLQVSFGGFKFDPAQVVKNDKNTGADVDNIITFGTIDGMIDGVLNGITNSMDSWAQSVITASQSAIPNVFIPPTGDNYAMAPLNFNDSGDLVVNVNIETK